MADWYYAKNGQRFGPVSSSELRQLAQSGKLMPDDLVFKEGAKDWMPASGVSGLFPAAGGKATTSSGVSPRSDPAPSGGGGGLDFADGGGGDDYDAPRGRSKRGGGLMDLLMFRRMISPWILIALFWLGVVGAILGGLGLAVTAVFAGGARGILPAIGLIISIPFMILGVRLYVEILILAFRMNETLSDIKNLLERRDRD